MDKQKEIENMTDLLVKNGIFNNLVCKQDYSYPDAVIAECNRQVAELLVNAGYGNIKQALTGFAKRLKQEFFFIKTSASKEALYQFTDSQLDKILKEILGE